MMMQAVGGVRVLPANIGSSAVVARARVNGERAQAHTLPTGGHTRQPMHNSFVMTQYSAVAGKMPITAMQCLSELACHWSFSRQY